MGVVAFLLRPAFGETDLIVNGGFELANTNAWKISGAGAAITNGPGAYGGVGYLTLGNVPGANQAAYQTVTLPTNLVAATLSFYYATISTDIATTNDVLSLYLLDTNQNVLEFLGSTSNADRNTGYYLANASLSAYAGKTIEIYFRVTTDSVFGGLTTFRIDNVSVIAGTTADIPSNDAFTNSTTLTGDSISLKATNIYALKEPGEPNHANNSGGHSLWWNWTPTALGKASISTSGSSFTTLLGVYTGSSISNLTMVASKNGNSLDSRNAQVSFNVTPGTVYQIAVDGYGGQSGTIALSLKFSLDTKPPTVSISSPASGAKLTNSTVVVQGKATDSLGVALVEYRLENSAGTNDYQAATGTNTWSATVSGLVPGPNTIRVRATDTSGNVSAAVSRSVTFVVVSPLTLTITGSGTVTPNLNGQLLAVGSPVTVTAKPTPGNIFMGWSGDLEATTPALKFTMQTNLVLQANFVPNPFLPAAGVYQGLFYDTNGTAHQSSGFANVNVTTAGRYSAKMILAGVSYSLSGQFSATGTASNSIAVKGAPPVRVQLQLDLSGAGLTGQLSNGAWTTELNAFRAKSSPPAGAYTMLLPAAEEGSSQPGGDGFGSVKVDALGKLSFKGIVGDGTASAQKALLTSNGQWPFYVSLYSGKGSIFGWLTFAKEAGRDISGSVNWFKPGQAAKYYPAGFTNQISAEGSSYVFTAGVPVLDFGTGQVSLANGNLASGFTNQITLDSASKVTNLSTNALKLTITTSSGLFKGSVVNPATGKPVTISGAVLQKQNFGGGLFLGTNQVGRVYFGP